MKIMFLALPLLYIGANIYLFIRAIQALSAIPLWGKIVFSILFWIIAFALFIGIGLREIQLPNILLKTLFIIGSIWIVFLLYADLFLIVADLIKIAIPKMGHTILYVLPITCLLLLYGYINYRNPKIEHIKIESDRYIAKENMRIVAISDVHLGYGTGIKALERYVEKINSQQPDLVLIIGDLIDNSLRPILEAPYDKALSKINAPLGIYMVPGNHEYISDIEKVSEYLTHTPITLLRDSVVSLPNGVQLIGRDDHSNKNRASLTKLLTKADPDLPTIVLDHQPYEINKADSLGVEILLCGHTHGGQVFPVNLITDQLFEQSHGYRKWEHTHVWVSSGLSVWGPPFRIGSNSDLSVIEISK